MCPDPHDDDPQTHVLAMLADGALADATTLTIERYGPGVLGLLAHAVSDEDAAKDIFSVWCEDVWRGLPSFEGRNGARLKTWAYRLAYNAAHRYRRRPHHKRAARIGHAALLNEADAALRDRIHETTQAIFKTTTKDAFRNIRAQLTPEQNMLLVLRVDRAMAWHDIALVLSDDPTDDAIDLHAESNRLRQRFHRIKAKLKRLAQREGLL